jgi:hypothetical protein
MKITAIAVLVLALAVLCACGKINEDPISAATFTDTLESNGFSVEDQTQSAVEDNDLENGGEELNKMLRAESGDSIITFLEMTGEDAATIYYDSFQGSLKEKKSDSGSESTLNHGSGAKYTLSADGMFYVVSRVGNTLVCVSGAESDRKELTAIVKELGY